MNNIWKDAVLPVDAFIRSIGIRRTTPLSIFLGAGASISSGLPSAEMCIWEWKRSIFLTNNPGLEEQFSEISLPSVRNKIQQWLDKQRCYPPNHAPDEYGFYIQECFPMADDRRVFFQDKVRVARPHTGYQLLCHLAEANIIQTVWSTNFDGLSARAAASFDLTPLEIGIDSQQRITRKPEQGEVLCVSLHGDYRYDELKNTSEEVQNQEVELRGALVEDVKSMPFIVVGYSGRDQSIMRAFETACSNGASEAFYWCGLAGHDPAEHVMALIQHARSHGREAFYIPTLGFNDVMTRMSLHCLENEQRENVRRCIDSLAPKNLLDRKPFHIPQYDSVTLIKSNAFEISCPPEALQFDLKVWPEEKVWSSLRTLAGDRPLVVVPFRKVLAFGTIEDIRDAFGENIKGPIERIPVSPDDLRHENGAIISLMRQALVRAMASKAGLKTDGTKRLWRSQVYKQVQHGDQSYNIHESVTIHLRRIGEMQHLILMPSLIIFNQEKAEAPREIANPIRLKILGYQHNKPFNEVINKWRTDLFLTEGTLEFEFPDNCGSPFKFHVNRSPIFAKIGSSRGRGALRFSEKIKSLVKHQGEELPEPKLVFSNGDGTNTVEDTHPIRGILENRPYDYPLTSKGLSPSLRVGVICPTAETNKLSLYLDKIHQTFNPSDNDRDYLLKYPGFQNAYNLSVELPSPGSPGWSTCPDPSTYDPVQGSPEIAHLINDKVDALQSSYAPHVVLIFFPDRWQNVRGYTIDQGGFDVHDFVKAYCVQRGIATQFLNQDTLANTNQCRVWWWLSLALYVKGMRTPWLLDNLADETAFVGLGFSVNHAEERGRHIILGCSHIYSARGEGLQYRLTKIENPIIRRGNPFMSRGDARRTGETIRQLFFDAHMKLPKRVVLHKRTPFIKEEREGFSDGLGGVQCIDMLEIQIDHALRYMASTQRFGETLTEDNFPVRRGTVVKLDDFTALLWVHGATSALIPRYKYFQGKRRIPAPLTIKRYAGETPLRDVASEILGLSKMNWNTFDLYTKHPASLESSNEIAKIGSLLQRFGALSYDYRLFM